MREPRWISKDAVIALHKEQLAENGGAEGIRDEGLLESALAKPLNVHAYDKGSPALDGVDDLLPVDINSFDELDKLMTSINTKGIGVLSHEAHARRGNDEETPDIFRLAASYAYGLARNHPFVDGNKRIAMIASFLFLNLNGWEIKAEKQELYRVFLALADGSISEGELTRWLRRHGTPLERLT